MSPPRAEPDDTTTLTEPVPAMSPPEPGLAVVFSGQEPTLTVLSLRREITLGREMEGGVQLPDRSLSRAHAVVSVQDGTLRVRDLGSHNGTYVNGARVDGTLSAHLPCVFRAGATVALGLPDIRPLAALSSLDRGSGTLAGPALRGVLSRIERAAAHADTLLVTGESGSGKELAAAVFHASGPLSRGPRVVVNCAAIPSEVAERLLFGAVRGAFSGADRDAEGYFHAASGGSLFLDEVGELDLEVQAKLLRAIETREILPLGATRAQRVRIAFTFATHRDLRALVAEGRFRSDLFFRIAEPSVHLPPLRERREEIPFFLARALAQRDPTLRAHARLVEAFLLLPWPGNVRELLGASRKAAENALAQGDTVVRAEHADPSAGLAIASALPLAPMESMASAPPMESSVPVSPAAPGSPRVAPREHDAAAIREALRASGYNITLAARALGMHRAHLYRIMQKHGIKPPR